MKKVLSIALSLVLLVSLLAGCGSTGGGSESSGQDATAQQESTTAAQKEDTEVTQTTLPEEDISVTEGKVSVETDPTQYAAGIDTEQIEVLNVGLDADVTNFNPWSYSGNGANQSIYSIYQPLFQPVNGKYYAAVGKEMSISEDGLTLTWEIFDNVYDSQGNHITADDVVFSLVKNLDVMRELDLGDIVKTGDYTVEWRLRDGLCVNQLTNMVKTHIVSQKAFEESPDEMQSDPVGTGCYKLTSYTSGYMFTLEAVEDYWQKDENYIHRRDMANAKTVNYYIITESSQRTIAMEQGTIDICTSINNDDLEKFDGTNGHWIAAAPNNLSMELFPNCDESSIMSDVNLRKAVCYSISNDAILESVYRGKGTAMHEYTPAWSVRYNSDWNTEDNYYNYDVDKAKEYLAQSNYNNETVRIACQPDATSTNIAQMLIGFFSQIGVNAEVQTYENSVFTQFIQTPNDWDIILYTRPCSTYHNAAIYDAFTQARREWGGSINFIFDDKLEELIQTIYHDDTCTDEAIQEVHEYMIENCYVMGIVNPTTSVVVPDSVSELTLSNRNTVTPGSCLFK